MNQRNRVLSVLFVVFGALWLWVEQPWKGDAHTRTLSTVEPLFPLLQPGREIARARVDVPGQEAVLIAKVLDRGQPRWVVESQFDHPVDLARLGALVESLRALRTRDVESINASSHAEYKIREGEATRVRFWAEDGQVLADLMAGGLRGQDVSSGQVPVLQFFVRAADSPVVYRTQQLTVPYDDPAAWCDTRFLADVQAEDVRTISRIDPRGEESWSLVQDPTVPRSAGEESEQEFEASGRWRMVSPESRLAPDFAGDTWVYTMLQLRANAVVGLASTPEGEEMFGSVQNIFELALESGRPFTIQFGALSEDGTSRLARVVGLPHLYAIPHYDAEQLAQPAAAMLVIE